MFCRKCGNKLLDNAKFCKVCGTEITINKFNFQKIVSTSESLEKTEEFSQQMPKEYEEVKFQQPVEEYEEARDVNNELLILIVLGTIVVAILVIIIVSLFAPEYEALKISEQKFKNELRI